MGIQEVNENVCKIVGFVRARHEIHYYLASHKNLPFPPRDGWDSDNMVIFWIKNIMLIPPIFLHFLTYVYLSVSNTYSVRIVRGSLFRGKHIRLLTIEDF